MKVAGIVLIVVGIIALIYGGITYTTHKKVLDIGPIQAERDPQHSATARPQRPLYRRRRSAATGRRKRPLKNLVKTLQCNKLHNVLIPKHIRDNRYWRGIMPEFAKLDIEAKGSPRLAQSRTDAHNHKR